jgi:hypothetical protein
MLTTLLLLFHSVLQFCLFLQQVLPYVIHQNIPLAEVNAQVSGATRRSAELRPQFFLWLLRATMRNEWTGLARGSEQWKASMTLTLTVARVWLAKRPGRADARPDALRSRAQTVATTAYLGGSLGLRSCWGAVRGANAAIGLAVVMPTTIVLPPGCVLQ